MHELFSGFGAWASKCSGFFAEHGALGEWASVVWYVDSVFAASGV